MRFLHPGFLALLWLALVPLVLYLFRRRSRSVRVSTLLFFDSLVREHRENAWLRHLKRLLSLLLTLAMLAAPVVVLARLVATAGDQSVRRVAIALDRSASMGAADASGETRLGAARRDIRARLDALPESVPVSLAVFDARTEVVEPATTNRRALARALDAVTVRPVEDDQPSALAAATRLINRETPAEIWLATDRVADPPPPDPAPGVTIRTIDCALPAPINAGITAFAVKKVPLLHQRFQVYLQVSLAAGTPGARTIRVEPQIGGVPLGLREVTVEPGEVSGLTIEVDAAQESLLSVSAHVDGDCLPLDDSAFVRLAAPRPLTVAWISEKPDPFTDLALRSLTRDDEISVFAGPPKAWPPEPRPDVAIFDGWIPAAWPENLPAIIIRPPAAATPIRAVALERPVPRDSIRVIDDRHPLLFHVSSSRVALTQTAFVDSAGTLEPLWVADDQAPVLLAGEFHGSRLVVMAFAPALSEQLPLTPSYPMLLANALFWCSESQAAARTPRIVRTGLLVDAPSGSIEWREWRDGKLGSLTRTPTPSPLVELDRLGLWRTSPDAPESAALLTSRSESNLRAAPAPPAAGPGGAPTLVRSALAGELSGILLWILVAILLAESWLFHRHAVT